MRTILVAYLLWFFLGVLGVHRFYCGRIGTGVVWFLTGGLFGIGWLIDVFLVPGMVREANAEHLSLRRGYGPIGPVPDLQPMYAARAPAVATPHAQRRGPAGASHRDRVVYCTRCGRPMRVPRDSAGSAYACPACRTVLEIPAFD